MVPVAQAGQLQGFETEVAVERDARIEVRLGHADAGGSGVQARFGTTDVGAALGQFGRQADRHAARRTRNRPRRAEFGEQAAGAGTDQVAEGVDQVRLVLFHLGQACLHAGHLGQRLGYLEVGGDAVGQARAGEFQAAQCGLEVVADDRRTVLFAAQLDIVARGFRQHRDLHVAQFVLAGFHRRVGGFQLASHAAPEVQLPGGVEAGQGVVVVAFAGLAGRIEQAGAGGPLALVVAAGVHRGQGVAAEAATDRAALLQARRGAAQVEVGTLDPLQ